LATVQVNLLPFQYSLGTALSLAIALEMAVPSKQAG
jgi:hypothetical protein